MSALGAVFSSRVTNFLHQHSRGALAGVSGVEVPDITRLPPEVGAVIADVYGRATADLFMVAAVIAALAAIAVLFINEKPLHAPSGDERAAKEQT